MPGKLGKVMLLMRQFLAGLRQKGIFVCIPPIGALMSDACGQVPEIGKTVSEIAE
jgi:hypothetical protein